MRRSNHVAGCMTFITLLLSLPILGGGIWLSTRANTTDCVKFLQWPFLLIAISIMVISFAGFAGACYSNKYLLWLYLFAMFVIIVALLGFIIFGFGVTSRGSGRTVVNRSYKDYYLEDYSGWLEERVAKEKYWVKIRSCIRNSKVCSEIGRGYGGVLESAQSFYYRRLTSIQSGCCKPPTECGDLYVNETTWNPGEVTGSSIDCSRWSNSQEQLCYSCNSCKAGVLSSLRKSWRRVSVINTAILVFLLIVYIIGFSAVKNIRRMNCYVSYEGNGMTKTHPAVVQC
ncbi:hypothetical protein GIB67_002218 [Kingdonia uniflora]|uniref:Tetraspanin-3 n=1 Tax=Kingdonia uniflora TaxID=39325 RepID=A0A7J7KWU7_9MAGN|nr:hypothetical protein GIB67_002218 [Kingdonia uniflora]